MRVYFVSSFYLCTKRLASFESRAKGHGWAISWEHVFVLFLNDFASCVLLCVLLVLVWCTYLLYALSCVLQCVCLPTCLVRVLRQVDPRCRPDVWILVCVILAVT